MTFQELQKNEMVKAYIQGADATLGALGYTEHAFAQIGQTADDIRPCRIGKLQHNRSQNGDGHRIDRFGLMHGDQQQRQHKKKNFYLSSEHDQIPQGVHIKKSVFSVIYLEKC